MVDLCFEKLYHKLRKVFYFCDYSKMFSSNLYFPALHNFSNPFDPGRHADFFQFDYDFSSPSSSQHFDNHHPAVSESSKRLSKLKIGGSKKNQLSSSDCKLFEKEMLDQHNHYRAKHRAPR